VEDNHYGPSLSCQIKGMMSNVRTDHKGGGVRFMRGRSVSISLLANDRVLVEPLSGGWTGIGH
jgi:hypothetical protein